MVNVDVTSAQATNGVLLGEAGYLRRVNFMSSYSIDITEVTVSAYKACVRSEMCTEPATDENCTWGIVGQENYPVNCVTWQQARTYCDYRGKWLPSEHEWEYAARFEDPSVHKYPWGMSSANYNTKLNMAVLTDGYQFTAPVGSYSPTGDSALGLQDMAGNVWEWTSSTLCTDTNDECLNCNADSLLDGGWCPGVDFPCQTCGNPQTDPLLNVVFKGGGYNQGMAYSRSAFHYYGDQTYYSPVIGFRCASFPEEE